MWWSITHEHTHTHTQEEHTHSHTGLAHYVRTHTQHTRNHSTAVFDHASAAVSLSPPELRRLPSECNEATSNEVRDNLDYFPRALLQNSMTAVELYELALKGLCKTLLPLG